MIDGRYPQFYNLDLMSYLKPLSEFERYARKLVEGSVDKLVMGKSNLLPLARQIISTAESTEAHGTLANTYVILVAPDLVGNKDDLEAVSRNLEDLLKAYSKEAGIPFAGPLKLNVTIGRSLIKDDYTIEAVHNDAESEHTRSYQSIDNATKEDDLSEQEAYLIIGGKRHVPIQQTVFTIGRHLDNNLVIESPSVSRYHAQIRMRHGQFIVRNMNSRTGTRVNGHEVTDSLLFEGDVINIGNVTLIFGDSGGSGLRRKYLLEDKGDTKPLPPQSRL